MNNPFEVINARLANIESLLIELKHPTIISDGGADKWFNIEELCSYLPDKPAISTVYNQVSARAIPCHKGGKKLRFLKSEIDSWLLQGKRKTFSDSSLEASTYLKKKGVSHA